MIRRLIYFVFIITLITIGLSLYLQPNDLSKCDANPGVDEKCQKVDAIVAISGGDTQARANEAIKLYKSGWSNVLIFSGAAQDKTGPSNAAAMAKIAINSGVPVESIYLDESSETTQQNAQNVQAIFAKIGAKRAILVTSGYHQRRASLEFSANTHDVAILNHPVQSDKDWSSMWWATPHGWWLASSEGAKIIVFYATGAK